MKIYFEDGKLINTNQLPECVDFVVDARHGATDNMELLDNLKESELKNEKQMVIYTNSIFAFDGQYAWNEELQVPEIYIRAGKHMVFTRIDKLTNRKLREVHNLAKMYVSGEFDK